MEGNVYCYETTIVFYVLIFQFLSIVVSFSISHPFRKPMHTNLIFTAFVAVGFVASTYLLLLPSDWVAELFELKTFPGPYPRFAVFGLILANW
jgi:magnesium-transporting ATPase (P-type)